MACRVVSNTAKSIETHIARLQKKAAAPPIVPRKVSIKAKLAPAPTPVAIATVSAVPAAPRYTSVLPVKVVAKISQRSTNIPRPDFTIPRSAPAQPALRSALKTSAIKKPKKTVTFAGCVDKTTAKVHFFDKYQPQGPPSGYPTNLRPHYSATRTIAKQLGASSSLMIRYDGKYKRPSRPGQFGPTGVIRTGRNLPTACFDCRLKKVTPFLPTFSLEAMESDSEDAFFDEYIQQVEAHICDNCLTF